MAYGQSCCPGRFSSAGGVQTGMAPGCRPLPLPPLVYAGEVSAERELPVSPRIGWTFVIAAPGRYAGFDLEAGDALVCTAMAPAEWTSFSGPVDHSMFVKFTDMATASKTGVVYVDPALDSSSANPVENRAVSSELDLKADAADFLTITNAEILHIVTGG